MLWHVEERKPAALRRREVVDCFNDDTTVSSLK